MRKLRTVADEYGSVLIGETWTSNVEQLKDYYGTKNDELQMPMDLMMTGFKGLSADEYRKHIAAVNAAGHWPVYVITNHDIVRSYTRYARWSAQRRHREDDGGALSDAARVGDYVLRRRDRDGEQRPEEQGRCAGSDRQTWAGLLKKGRDGERTPMQWNDAANAGFSVAKPWLPVPASASTHNVADEMKDPGLGSEFLPEASGAAAYGGGASGRGLRFAERG